MKASEALLAKGKLSVGVVERQEGEASLTSDVLKANRVAETRRELDAFEKRLQGNQQQGNSSSDSEDEYDTDEVTSWKRAGLVTADLDWSDEASHINQLAQWKRTRGIGRLENVKKELRTLRLKQCGIEKIDPEFLELSNLHELNLSHNMITVIENLPPKLISLQAYDNQVQRLSISRTQCAPKLVHLGLGCNEIAQIGGWVDDCISLKSLDLSFNHLTGLREALDKLERLESLRFLRLEGNPFCMLPNYRGTVLTRLPNVVELDGIPRDEELVEGDADGLEQEQARIVLRVHNAEVLLKVDELRDNAAANQGGQRITRGLAVEVRLPGSQATARSQLVSLESLRQVDEENGAEETEFKTGQDSEADSSVEMRATTVPFEDFTVSESFKPTVRMRESLDLEGIPLRLVLLERVEQETTASVITDGIDAAGSEKEDQDVLEPEYTVVEEKEYLISEGVIETSDLLVSTNFSKLSLEERRVDLKDTKSLLKSRIKYPGCESVCSSLPDVPCVSGRESKLTYSLSIN